MAVKSDWMSVTKTCLTALLTMLWCSSLIAQQRLKYVPAPPDNPLKGLVPYSQPHADRFPHSMEFSYLPLSELLTGPDTYDWQPLEKLLNDIASRRHQTVFRIWMEYPGRKDGIPKYLEDNGLKVTEWLNTNTDPFPRQMVRTPDYDDANLRTALQSFIQAFGQKYDGDPRIGFITAGILGTWGEWHTYPRGELMASKTVQAEVMDAYEKAFQKTPVLLRYPAGDNDWAHAANHKRHLGYHDDSFAWATLDTGKKQDDWFFVPAMKAAGESALNKWKTSPIGGEIRPELWGQIFDEKPAHNQAQDFAECVRQTHATWLMDTGMFEKQQSKARIQNAIQQVQKMGYEFHVKSCTIVRPVLNSADSTAAKKCSVTLQLKNTGIAPFYYDWKVELAAVRAHRIVKSYDVDWSVLNLLPDSETTTWNVKLPETDLPQKFDGFAVRIVNPMPNGMPLRFANEYKERLSDGWLALNIEE